MDSANSNHITQTQKWLNKMEHELDNVTHSMEDAIIATINAKNNQVSTQSETNPELPHFDLYTSPSHQTTQNFLLNSITNSGCTRKQKHRMLKLYLEVASKDIDSTKNSTNDIDTTTANTTNNNQNNVNIVDDSSSNINHNDSNTNMKNDNINGNNQTKHGTFFNDDKLYYTVIESVNNHFKDIKHSLLKQLDSKEIVELKKMMLIKELSQRIENTDTHNNTVANHNNDNAQNINKQNSNNNTKNENDSSVVGKNDSNSLFVLCSPINSKNVTLINTLIKELETINNSNNQSEKNINGYSSDSKTIDTQYKGSARDINNNNINNNNNKSNSHTKAYSSQSLSVSTEITNHINTKTAELKHKMKQLQTKYEQLKKRKHHYNMKKKSISVHIPNDRIEKNQQNNNLNNNKNNNIGQTYDSRVSTNRYDNINNQNAYVHTYASKISRPYYYQNEITQTESQSKDNIQLHKPVREKLITNKYVIMPERSQSAMKKSTKPANVTKSQKRGPKIESQVKTRSKTQNKKKQVKTQAKRVYIEERDARSSLMNQVNSVNKKAHGNGNGNAYSQLYSYENEYNQRNMKNKKTRKNDVSNKGYAQPTVSSNINNLSNKVQLYGPYYNKLDHMTNDDNENVIVKERNASVKVASMELEKLKQEERKKVKAKRTKKGKRKVAWRG